MSNQQLKYTLDDIRSLERKISELAMRWRGQPEQRNEIKKEYHNTIAILYSLGWDDILDVDCELPENDMPEEYKRRHPWIKSNRPWPHSWYG